VRLDALSGPGPGILFGFDSPDDPDRVVAFYLRELPIHGWHVSPPDVIQGLGHRTRLRAQRPQEHLELDIVAGHEPDEPTRILGSWRAASDASTR
jgi:hypothetical protein